MVALYGESLEDPVIDAFEAAAAADRARRATDSCLPWCGEHRCTPHTCFPLHHPEAFKGRG